MEGEAAGRAGQAIGSLIGSGMLVLFAQYGFGRTWARSLLVGLFCAVGVTALALLVAYVKGLTDETWGYWWLWELGVALWTMAWIARLAWRNRYD